MPIDYVDDAITSFILLIYRCFFDAAALFRASTRCARATGYLRHHAAIIARSFPRRRLINEFFIIIARISDIDDDRCRFSLRFIRYLACHAIITPLYYDTP